MKWTCSFVQEYNADFGTFCIRILWFVFYLLKRIMSSYAIVSLWTWKIFSGLFLAGNKTDRVVLLEVEARIAGDPLWAGFMECNHPLLPLACLELRCCRHQSVATLDLQSLKLAGYHQPHVGNLSFLRFIHLQNNSFSNEIEIGCFHRLEKSENVALDQKVWSSS